MAWTLLRIFKIKCSDPLMRWLAYSLLLSLVMSMGFVSPSFAEKDISRIAAESSRHGQELADKIASITSRAIYNLDSDQLLAVIENYLEENRQIQSLQIVENVKHEVLLTYFRRDDHPVYNQRVPDSFSQYAAFSATVLFEGEAIGTVTIHYVDAPSSPAAGKKISLTDDELAWIKLHPVIRASNEPDYAPFDFIENGQPAGFSIDYLNLAARRVGIQLEFVQDIWENLVRMGEKKEIDLLHTIFYTPERAVFFNFTKPYKSVVKAIYVREGVSGIQSLADLAGRKVILSKGDC